MKHFDIIRYLKKWWPIVVLMSSLAGVFFMRYAENRQSYTAQCIIKYTYAQAEEGMTPNGEILDVSEIFSSAVVKQAIENLGLDVNVDLIRSGGTVSEIIPDDVISQHKALLARGEKPREYHPTEYVVQLEVGREYRVEYARAVLDEIIGCYFARFGEKYGDYSEIPNSTEDIDEQDYDYLEIAEFLDDSVSGILSQLGNCQKAHPEFISSVTGLSLSDLADEYTYVSKGQLTYLFSEILGGKLTKNREILLKKYQQRYNSYTMSSEVYGKKAEAILEIIESYKENSSAQGSTDDNESNSLVLSNVYEEKDNSKMDRTTVYDELFDDYAALLNQKSNALIDADYCQHIIEEFSLQPDESGNEEFSRQTVENEIEALQERLDILYEKLSLTMTEYNEYTGAVDLSVLSSTTVSEKINVRRYIILGVTSFFALGVCGAILLGRFQDFVESLLFTEQLLDMPNRTACDLFIKNNTSCVLPAHTVCVVIELLNLSKINTTYSREKGNEMMVQFANFIKEAAATCGTVYYNGSQQFVGFFESCTLEDAESFADYLYRLVRAYNEESDEARFEYSIGISESETNHVYSIRALLKEALHAQEKQEV